MKYEGMNRGELKEERGEGKERKKCHYERWITLRNISLMEIILSRDVISGYNDDRFIFIRINCARKLTNECIDEWKNERMNEWMNE